MSIITAEMPFKKWRQNDATTALQAIMNADKAKGLGGFKPPICHQGHQWDWHNNGTI